MSDLPNITELRHFLERLKANDIPWFRERYRNGDLAWLRDRLPAGEFEELGRRLESGDLDWLRSRIGTLEWSSVPGAGDLLKGVGPLTAVRPGLGATTTADKAGTVAAGAAGAGALGVGGGAAPDQRKRKALLALIPLLIIAGLIALALNKCGKSDKDAGDAAADTTIAAAADTTPAQTTPVVTEAPATPVGTDALPAATNTVAAAAASPTTTSAATSTVATSTVAASPTTTSAATADLLGTAGAAGGFSTLTAAVGAAGLTETLKGPGPFTVFAPTDDAFKALPAGVLDALLAHKDALAKVLTYHVVPGALKAADLKAGAVKSVEGDDLNVTLEGTTVKINGAATIIKADVAATNGVIHAIDQVLLPPGFDVNALLAGPSTTVASVPAATNAAGDATPEDLTVYFASGSAALDAAAQAKIAGAVTFLKGRPDATKVNLVGHADKNGNAAANQALSEKRAANVQAALTTGLAGKSVTFSTAAKGDSEPVANLAKSRRVTIEIVK